jgi:hypothetical protein
MNWLLGNVIEKDVRKIKMKIMEALPRDATARYKK